MKANNLTVSVPNCGCDKNCPYCVSKCTGAMKSNLSLMIRNVPKVLNLARMSQVSSVLITGKGEPCLSISHVLDFAQTFREFPLEMQTNGIWLQKNLSFVDVLATSGMNVIAVSIDTLFQVEMSVLSEVVHKSGMLLRVCLNVTNNEYLFDETGFDTFREILWLIQRWKIDQLTLRKIVAPNYVEETKQSKWIKENCDAAVYDRLQHELMCMCKNSGHHLRHLQYGAEVYDLDGITVSYSDYCMQDDNDTEDIRSLIFQEDGHVYTSWNSDASKLF